MSDYFHGWQLFANNSPIEACENDTQRRGWQQALRDCANTMAGTEF